MSGVTPNNFTPTARTPAASTSAPVFTPSARTSEPPPCGAGELDPVIPTKTTGPASPVDTLVRSPAAGMTRQVRESFGVVPMPAAALGLPHGHDKNALELLNGGDLDTHPLMSKALGLSQPSGQTTKLVRMARALELASAPGASPELRRKAERLRFGDLHALVGSFSAKQAPELARFLRAANRFPHLRKEFEALKSKWTPKNGTDVPTMKPVLFEGVELEALTALRTKQPPAWYNPQDRVGTVFFRTQNPSTTRYYASEKMLKLSAEHAPAVALINELGPLYRASKETVAALEAECARMSVPEDRTALATKKAYEAKGTELESARAEMLQLREQGMAAKKNLKAVVAELQKTLQSELPLEVLVTLSNRSILDAFQMHQDLELVPTSLAAAHPKQLPALMKVWTAALRTHEEGTQPFADALTKAPDFSWTQKLAVTEDNLSALKSFIHALKERRPNEFGHLSFHDFIVGSGDSARLLSDATVNAVTNPESTFPYPDDLQKQLAFLGGRANAHKQHAAVLQFVGDAKSDAIVRAEGGKPEARPMVINVRGNQGTGKTSTGTAIGQALIDVGYCTGVPDRNNPEGIPQVVHVKALDCLRTHSVQQPDGSMREEPIFDLKKATAAGIIPFLDEASELQKVGNEALKDKFLALVRDASGEDGERPIIVATYAGDELLFEELGCQRRVGLVVDVDDYGPKDCFGVAETELARINSTRSPGDKFHIDRKDLFAFAAMIAERRGQLGYGNGATVKNELQKVLKRVRMLETAARSKPGARGDEVLRNIPKEVLIGPRPSMSKELFDALDEVEKNPDISRSHKGQLADHFATLIADRERIYAGPKDEAELNGLLELTADEFDQRERATRRQKHITVHVNEGTNTEALSLQIRRLGVAAGVLGPEALTDKDFSRISFANMGSHWGETEQSMLAAAKKSVVEFDTRSTIVAKDDGVVGGKSDSDPITRGLTTVADKLALGELNTMMIVFGPSAGLQTMTGAQPTLARVLEAGTQLYATGIETDVEARDLMAERLAQLPITFPSEPGWKRAVEFIMPDRMKTKSRTGAVMTARGFIAETIGDLFEASGGQLGAHAIDRFVNALDQKARAKYTQQVARGEIERQDPAKVKYELTFEDVKSVVETFKLPSGQTVSSLEGLWGVVASKAKKLNYVGNGTNVARVKTGVAKPAADWNVELLESLAALIKTAAGQSDQPEELQSWRNISASNGNIVSPSAKLALEMLLGNPDAGQLKGAKLALALQEAIGKCQQLGIAGKYFDPLDATAALPDPRRFDETGDEDKKD